MDICIYGGIVLLVAPYVVENGIELCRSEGHAAGGFGRFSAVDENCHIVRSDAYRHMAPFFYRHLHGGFDALLIVAVFRDECC